MVLGEADPTEEEVMDLYGQVIRSISLMLGAGLVHGNLSPYNILVWEGKVWIINLLQTVDLHWNDGAIGLFYRDLRNVSDCFDGRGIRSEPLELFEKLLHVKYYPNKTYPEILAMNRIEE